MVERITELAGSQTGGGLEARWHVAWKQDDMLTRRWHMLTRLRAYWRSIWRARWSATICIGGLKSRLVGQQSSRHGRMYNLDGHPGGWASMSTRKQEDRMVDRKATGRLCPLSGWVKSGRFDRGILSGEFGLRGGVVPGGGVVGLSRRELREFPWQKFGRIEEYHNLGNFFRDLCPWWFQYWSSCFQFLTWWQFKWHYNN